MRKTLALCALLSLFGVLPMATAGMSDTAFTYQGRLRDGGLPANGAYNIDVSLWGAEVGGTQIGVDIEFNNHPVTSGIFTMELDFGAAAFNGDPRWLEFSVNGAELSPRQAVTNAPGAFRSETTRGLEVDAMDNVGVGTTAPAARVDAVADATTAREVLYRASVPDAPGDVLLIQNGTVGPGVFAPWILGHRGTSNTHAIFYSGSTTPALDTGTVPIVNFGAYTFDGATTYGTVANRPLFQWGNANIPHMIMDAAGNVGIGTVAPDAPLHVVGNIQCDSEVHSEYVNAVNFGIGGVAVNGRSTGTNGSGVLGINNNGKGVRRQGDIGVEGDGEDFDFLATGAGIDYSSTSSLRWKSNINPIANPLNKLTQLRGVTFDWDEDHGGHHDVGMIAEEVGQVLPEIVQYEENGVDAIGMDYSKLTPLLVEATKVLNAKVETLQAENEALCERLEKLEALLSEGSAPLAARGK